MKKPAVFPSIRGTGYLISWLNIYERRVGVGGQYKFSGFKFIAFLKAPSHLHNEMQNFTQQAKWVARSWIILIECVTVFWYFYCRLKVALYDDVRQLLHVIKLRSAREKCVCLLWCMTVCRGLLPPRHCDCIIDTVHSSGLAGFSLNFCAYTFRLWPRESVKNVLDFDHA
jgi:hypothetical protein